MPLPRIEPPLLNSANPWSTDEEELKELFNCPFTGAITTRTSLINGFEHDTTVHQYAFFNASTHILRQDRPNEAGLASLNTLGYSPLPLSSYLEIIHRVIMSSTFEAEVASHKPCIISVTGSSAEVVECYRQISIAQTRLQNPLLMEINLSCPNIPGKPPPAYSRSSLVEYLYALRNEIGGSGDAVGIGIKTPPYTYHDQFQQLIDALLEVPDCIDFITATNTLGSSLLLTELDRPVLSSSTGTGIGGMAGSALHPLALGNVKLIRSMLDQHPELKEIDVIGIGGVSDKAGFERMKSVGAKVVGVGTALGVEGVSVFQKILSTFKPLDIHH